MSVLALLERAHTEARRMCECPGRSWQRIDSMRAGPGVLLTESEVSQ